LLDAEEQVEDPGLSGQVERRDRLGAPLRDTLSESTTARASRVSPSENFSPGRIFRLRVFRSPEYAHDVAIPGAALPFTSRPMTVS
jgi:hypothetical protein